MPTVLVTDYAWPNLDVEHGVLAPAAADFLVAERGDETELTSLAPAADAILTCWKPVTATVLDAAKRCRLVSRYGVGLDNIDVRHATHLGIPVTNVPDYCVDEVSDHALALILACARGLAHFAPRTRAGVWDLKGGPRLRRLRGRTLGLVGYGRIARSLAPKAAALGLDVLAYSPSLEEASVAPPARAATSLEDLLRAADFVSLHLPLTEASRGLIDAQALGCMKRSAYLVNTSRGEIVVEGDLRRALEEGRIAGAALDVLACEPPRADHPLLAIEGVLVTPHAAFCSEEAIEELARRAAAHVLQALRGEVPQNVVNAEVLARPGCRLGRGRA